MEKWKKTMLHGVICLGLLCVIWGGYFLSFKQIEEGQRQKIDLCYDDFSWVYQVDKVSFEKKEVIIRGFAFQLGDDAKEEACEIILHDIESGKDVFPEMKYMERSDVNKYFLCEYDYTNSGFLASFKAKKLDLQNKNYEILLRVLGTKKAFQTGVYISNGEMVYTNPILYKPLDVAGTELESIVEQGILRVYRPEYGMYVYQYEGELYWIAEPEYDFEDDGNTTVQWHLDTTQIENLPKNRLENQWYFDNLGFRFVDMELLNINTGKYRVAKKSLPTEYSIYRMNTGQHIEEWIWKHDFRPYYELGQ